MTNQRAKFALSVSVFLRLLVFRLVVAGSTSGLILTSPSSNALAHTPNYSRDS